MKRFYTCPLDQVVQEINQSCEDKSISLSFARLFTEFEGQEELLFDESLGQVLKLFCNSVLRVAADINDPEKYDDKNVNERAIFDVWNTCAFSIQAAIHAEMDSGKASMVVPSGM